MPKITHKDLPGGSQDWAAEVDKGLAKIAELEAILRRVAENVGIDMANPRRGVNSGATPSVKNPVDQKLSSLSDVQTYNVADKQVLTWNQQGQKWLPATPAGGAAVPIPEEIVYYGDFTFMGLGEWPNIPGNVWAFSGYSPEGTWQAQGTHSVNLLAGRWNASDGSLMSFEMTEQPNRAPEVNLRVEDYDSNTSSEIMLLPRDLRITLKDTGGRSSEFTGDHTNMELAVYTSTSSCTMGVVEYAAYINAPMVNIPYCTTATRPTLRLRDGSLVFDTDLKKPIFYDFAGATWRDALGTAV